VIGGNERVVRPRLADAKFFFDQDRKKTLASRVPQLAKVVYHNKLGTQGERASACARSPAPSASSWAAPRWRRRPSQAAQLAKADLLTDMVGEFPELQGTWAATTRCTTACRRGGRRHRRPLQAPLCRRQPAARPVGTVVALADKLETLVGLFGIGTCPPATATPSPCAAMRWA
jgi:glycyl-tRNA synthetase beta chain